MEPVLRFALAILLIYSGSLIAIGVVAVREFRKLEDVLVRRFDEAEES